MAAPTRARRRMGRFRLLNAAADTCRYARAEHGHAGVACPYCAETVRTRHTGSDTTREGGLLHAALIEHLAGDYDDVEMTR